MLNQVLQTLSTLANVANSEATTLSKNTDQASKTKAKALYTKQSQIATLINHLANFEKMVAAQPDIVKENLDPVVQAYRTIVETLDQNLKQLHGVKYPDPRLNFGLAFPVIGAINDSLQGLERNIELRKEFLLSLDKEAAELQYCTNIDEINAKKKMLNEKHEEYLKLCKEDEKLKDAILKRNVDEVKRANLRWAQLLEQKFQKKDLPEIAAEAKKQPQPKGVSAPMMQWGKNFFTSITDLFKAMNDPDKKGVEGKMMGIIGSLIHLVLNAFGSLFKKFLGNGEEAKKQVDDFADNATKFFTDMIGSGITCQPGKPCAKPGSTVTPTQTPKSFTPSFASTQAATQGTPYVAPTTTPVSTVAPVQQQSQASIFKPWTWF